jgi:glycerophosphoryl diester phosphodiesterase
MLLLGHRGASRYAAENSFRAFDLALEHGCDGIEFDVRLTADGQAIICHDERYKHREIASSNSGSPGPIGELPLLGEVISRYGSRGFLYIELKVTGVEQQTLAALRKYPPERGYVVASFLPEVLERLHALDATVPLGLVAGRRPELARWPDVPSQWVMVRSSLVSADLMQVLKQSGRRVFAWTVNSESEMRSMAAAGVDGLQSDDTVLAARVFGRRPHAVSAH